MADTDFSTGVVISSSWLNEVNDALYRGTRVHANALYGVDETGVSDSTTALQAAVTYAATLTAGNTSIANTYDGARAVVYLAPGNYRINSGTITVPAGVSIVSDAPGARLFTTNNAGSHTIMIVGDNTDATAAWENHFHNIAFASEVSNEVTNTAVKIYRSFLGSFVNCSFYNFYNGVDTNRMNRYIFKDCRWFQNRDASRAAYSVRLRGSASNTGGGNHFTNCEFGGNDVSVAGTYSRSVNTVTITRTAHGLSTGRRVRCEFSAGTGGTATNGTYEITVLTANTFTITDTASGSITGSPSVTLAFATVDSHILVEETDGLYLTSCHFRDADDPLRIAPTGSTGQEDIDSIFAVNCYFDETYQYNVNITGTAAGSNRYQFIWFSNCYFRGTGGQALHNFRVRITDSSFTGTVKDIKVMGGGMRQAASQAVRVFGQTASATLEEPETFSLIGVNFEDSLFAGADQFGTGIIEADNCVITNCTINANRNAATVAEFSINNSAGTSNSPSITFIGNDLANSNCSAVGNKLYAITETVKDGTVVIKDNTMPKTGYSISQQFGHTTTTATATNIFDYVNIQAGQCGTLDIEIMGNDATGAVYAVYGFRDVFYRGTGNLVFGSGTDTAATKFTGITSGAPVTATVAKNVTGVNAITVRVTPPAVTTAGSFVVDRTYIITSLGTTTNWTSIGADSSPAVGEIFTATGVGSGDGQAQLLIDWKVKVNIETNR